MSRREISIAGAVCLLIGVGVAFFMWFNSTDDRDLDRFDATSTVSGAPEPEATPKEPRRESATAEKKDGANGRTLPTLSETRPTKERKTIAAIEGRIFDPAQKPVKDAAVTLLEDIGDTPGVPLLGTLITTVMSDDEGRYLIDDVRVNRRYLMRVDHQNFSVAFIQPIELSAGEIRRQDVSLMSGSRISGKVVDAAGTGIAGAVVTLADPTVHSEDPDREYERTTKSADDGVFALGAITPGAKRLIASKEGFATVTDQSIQVFAGADRDGIVLKMPPGSTITGRVKDTDGNALEGVSIAFQPLLPTNPFDESAGGVSGLTLLTVPSVKSEKDGTFKSPGLVKGSYSLFLQKRGYSAPVGRDQAATDGPPVELSMTKCAAFKGRIVDAETGEPIKEFSIALTMSKEGLATSGRTTQYFETTDGRFEYVMPDLGFGPSRDRWLIGIARDYAPARGEPMIAANAGDTGEVVINLKRGATAIGRVVDQKGAGVGGADVEIVTRMEGGGGAAEIFVRALADRSQRNYTVRTTTDAQGNYRVKNLIDGLHRIRVSRAGYAIEDRDLTEKVAATGETKFPDVVLSRGADIFGVVFTKSRETVPGARVTLSSKARFGASMSAVADDGGNYRFSNVIPGVYYIRVVERPGEAMNPFGQMKAAKEVMVGDGESLRQDLDD